MKIVALSGGVGGAKLAHGLSLVLPPEDLTVIVNTGDDFEHFGLYICPDLDTVCYALAGLANPKTGWGYMRETWAAITHVEKLGGPGWFQLGDRDLATHLERTRRLREGVPLSQITEQFCSAWGIYHRILPVSDQPIHTIVQTDQGDLAFQEYFVHRRCEPRVKGFEFEGAESAPPAPGVIETFKEADAVVFCPSNPWVSIAPILAIGSLRAAIQVKTAVAVSPIIGGHAVKGPAAKMYLEMGIQPSALAVARHYGELIKGFVLDQTDKPCAAEVEAGGQHVLVTRTLMRNVRDRRRLAEDVLNFIGSLQ
jgi:LPPG:FO 2-phospho-L-lactate transferase